jgi:hypothetical protein
MNGFHFGTKIVIAKHEWFYYLETKINIYGWISRGFWLHERINDEQKLQKKKQ